MIDYSSFKTLLERQAKALERIADSVERLTGAVEPIAALVVEVSEEGRTQRVSASEVTKVSPAPPHVPRPRANL